MTPEQINKMLAEKVMGYEYFGENDLLIRTDLWVKSCSEWHPYTDIRQAIECAEKFKNWNVGRHKNGYRCYIYHNDEWIAGLGDTPSAAICEAAAIAVNEGFMK